MRLILIFTSWFLLTPVAFSASPSAESSSPSPEEVSNLFRSLLLANLPNPLYEKGFNWGNQRETIVGLKWKRDGLLLKPEPQKKMHNDGTWRKIRVEIDNPAKTLQFGVSEIKQVEEGKITFGVNVTFPVQIYFDQQNWESGVRLFSGSTRARCKVGVLLQCEATSRTEYQKGAFLPDVIFRMRVTDARLGYSDVVVEHTLGVGGDAAKLLGEAVFETIKQAKPSLESDLLVKGNAAIIKAADTKEVRLGLGKLFEKK